MIRIKRINESTKPDISVIDVEDELQEVWDKYRSIIDDYTILRNFVDYDFVLFTGDQSVTMGSDIEYFDEERGDKKIMFEVRISIGSKMHSEFDGWGDCGYFDMTKFTGLLSEIKSCLSHLSSGKISIGFDSTCQSPELDIIICFSTDDLMN